MRDGLIPVRKRCGWHARREKNKPDVNNYCRTGRIERQGGIQREITGEESEERIRDDDDDDDLLADTHKDVQV